VDIYTHSNSRQVKDICKGYHMPNTRIEDISHLPSIRKRTHQWKRGLKRAYSSTHNSLSKTSILISKKICKLGKKRYSNLCTLCTWCSVCHKLSSYLPSFVPIHNSLSIRFSLVVEHCSSLSKRNMYTKFLLNYTVRIIALLVTQNST